ncbi:Oidioi.mRNA.OKI2018_I69.chr1.g1696.t1.cds [Oikopleura dioica]|uniref:Oidioi.mRNA.OKI2018_I69.chr1.g1696.t1.cds n=1 Tax=Oikopleura dioica TaxID=34765 RepID=A0ABN7SS73_OIKDI|nr:Oidioi.mRNA.OKI2018_I69.chr1.g1696.t1.cds [Oikopleura dioica]
MSKSQIASAGYFQQYASLTAEERESRRVICDAKIDETQAAFPIENGSWACPGYGQTRSKVRCHPTCGQGFLPDWTEKSISKPKKMPPDLWLDAGTRLRSSEKISRSEWS